MLSLEGCIVTIDKMGTQANIARAIHDRGAHYILAVKDNQPTLADSIRDFFVLLKQAPQRTPYTVCETVQKNHGRIETRCCYAFEALQCLYRSEQWPALASFVVIESERWIQGKTRTEQHFYISSLPAQAKRIASAIRQP